MSQETKPDSTKPASADEIPPAAVELAAKLFDLAREGDTDSLSQYLAAGTPATLTNDKGDTLLMLAAYHGHAATVSLLLSHKADPNVQNDKGQSPLAGAVFKGFEDVVKVLVDGGADGDMGRPSAKDAAKMFKRVEMYEILGISAGGIELKRSC